MNPGPKHSPAVQSRIIGEHIVKHTAPGAPATITTFPIARRRDVIAARAAAAAMRARSPASADKHVGRSLRSFMDELRSQEIPQPLCGARFTPSKRSSAPRFGAQCFPGVTQKKSTASGDAAGTARLPPATSSNSCFSREPINDSWSASR
jgi:hypothetical protein